MILKKSLSICLTVLIAFYWTPWLPAKSVSQAGSSLSVSELLELTYLELFKRVPELEVSQSDVERAREQLEEEKEQEEDRLEDQRDSIEEQIDQAQDQLEDISQEATPSAKVRRHELHCRIQELRKERQEAELALETGIDVKYDNKFAKLKVLTDWPKTYAETQQMIEADRLGERKFGNFRDVGFRNDVFDDQKEDIETGREVIEEMRRRNLLPPEVEDPEVVQYMKDLTHRIARHSDLQVPLELTVLKSEEINAFALPGGFFFVNSGLILKAQEESQLAGVIAHEIAHAAARHGNRLMTRANIAQIIFQAAQVAALIFTGGVASIGTYYALQYGFYGLGLVLNLALLGVSRDFEEEADILGTQYLWHAGYDTTGFINFFGLMAEEEGYATGLSWFRTHPPFYERMSRTYQEILFLPEQKEPIVDSSEFHQVQDRLEKIMKEMEEEDRQAPTLRTVYHCEDQNQPSQPREGSR